MSTLGGDEREDVLRPLVAMKLELESLDEQRLQHLRHLLGRRAGRQRRADVEAIRVHATGGQPAGADNLIRLDAERDVDQVSERESVDLDPLRIDVHADPHLPRHDLLRIERCGEFDRRDVERDRRLRGCRGAGGEQEERGRAGGSKE